MTIDVEEIECWLWAEYLGAQSNFLLRDMASVLKSIMGAEFLNPAVEEGNYLADATVTEWNEAITYANYFQKSENWHLIEIGRILIEWNSDYRS